MKKIIPFIAIAALFSIAIAQDYTKVIHRTDGRSFAIRTTDVDSVSYIPSEQVPSEQYNWIDTIYKEIHDTLVNNYFIHDTIIQENIVYVHDTIYITNTNSDIYNGHAFVDLGLPSGIKWATCNVGANDPEDFGDYFAWGETETHYIDGHAQDDYYQNWKPGKNGYNWASYKWCKGVWRTLTKYCSIEYLGTVDNKTELEIEDDAARQNWGGLWRIPTLSELQELVDNCTFEEVCSDISGYKVTGTNGNWIFLPAAGYLYDYGSYPNGPIGFYCSRTIDSNNSDNNYGLIFDPYNYHASLGIYSIVRYFGQSVRPVVD